MSEGKRKLKHIEETVDTSTGEVTTITKSFSVKTTSEAFYMTFIGNMASFYKITSITDVKILAKFCENTVFNTNKVSITTSKRKELCKSLNVTSQTFSNSINRLKKLGLITGSGGDYEINPTIFWKGTTDERSKLLKEGGLELRIKFKAHDSYNDEN